MSVGENLKFFCENCGKEVKRNASACPHCGRFFASVKCPSCGYAGAASQFENGCPRCGYALRPRLKKEEKGKKKTHPKKKKKGTYDDSLPVWLYAFIFCLFLIVVSIVLFR